MTFNLRQIWRWLASAAALIVLAAGTVRFVHSGVLPGSARLSGDFAVAFPSAYFAALRPDWPSPGDVWHYGPMMHFLTIPLFVVPRHEHVAMTWTVINLLVLLATFFWTIRIAGGTRGVLAIASLVGLWLGFQPLVNCVAQGNIEIVEMAVLIGGLIALDRGRPRTAGALVAAAAMIKMLPVGFLGWFVLRQFRQALASAVLALVAIALAGEATLGWAHSANVTQMPGRVEVLIAGFHDLSITALFLHRAATIDTSSAEPSMRWTAAARARAQRVGWLVSAALAATYAWLIWRRRRQAIAPHEIGVLFLLMLLLTPIGHDYYFVFALVPLTIAWLTALATRQHALAVGIIAAYVLMSPPLPYSVIDRAGVFDLPFAYVWNFFDMPTYGALLLLSLVTRQWLATDATKVAFA